MRKVVCSYCGGDWSGVMDLGPHCPQQGGFRPSKSTVIVEDDTVEAFKAQIRLLKHTFVIQDPYPEISQYEQLKDVRGIFGKLFPEAPRPNIPSPHKAWKDGFDFAWSLIEEKLK